jgi:hypothetical protein
VSATVPALEALEQSLASGDLADARPALTYLAGQAVTLEADELHGARRRAVLLLATGGHPLRGLALDGRAVTALAADLKSPTRERQLRDGLAGIQPHAHGLPHCSRALAELVADPDLAWRAFACALLADELSD